MEVVTLLIAVAALVIAVAAYTRTGGIQDLRRQVDALSSASGSVREKTADTLVRLERLIRGRERSSQEKGDQPPSSPGPRL